MQRTSTISAPELEELDRFYREGGLRRMASPHVRYHDSSCPHAGSNPKMEWIDFQLELFGDPEGIYKPLVRSWWEGTGFVGRCPGCGGLDSIHDNAYGSPGGKAGAAVSKAT